jgi:hypothetical protein
MKRLIVVISVLAASGALFAQPVVLTLKTHGLAPGLDNQMKTSSFSDPGTAGKDQVWDLSGMGSDKDFRSFVSPVSDAEKELYFPEANVVLNEEGALFYYHIDEEAQSAWGVINQCGRMVMKFRSPLTNMRYPFTYGDEYSGIYEGIYYFPNTEAPLAGTYNVKADGYGRLILPGGIEINNALRVVFTHSYDVMLDTSTQTHDVIAYRWYSNSERYPLAVIIGTRSSTSGRDDFSYRALYRVPEQVEELKTSMTEPAQDPVEKSIEEPGMGLISEKTQEPEHNLASASTKESEQDLIPGNLPEPVQDLINIYPNPAKEKFTLEYTVNDGSKVFIELFDYTGKKIATLINQYKKAGSYSEEFSTGRYNLKHGLYHIRSRIGNQSYSNTFIRE